MTGTIFYNKQQSKKKKIESREERKQTIMKIFDKIRIKRKIHKVCCLIVNSMPTEDAMECIENIADCLELPVDRKKKKRFLIKLLLR